MDFERGTDQVLERVDTVRTAEDVDDTFEALYRQRYRDIYRYVLMMLRRTEDAEDVAGEVFQKAYAAWGSGRKRRPRADGQACSRSAGDSVWIGTRASSRGGTLSVPRNHVQSREVAIVYSTMIVTKSTA